MDELKGDLGPGEQREGEVIIALFVDEEIVKAKVNLSVDHHRLAHQAYGLVVSKELIGDGSAVPPGP